MQFDALSHRVIGCAIEVHRELGPGLLESAYQQCLEHELTLAGIPFRAQEPLPIVYRGLQLDCGYKLDFVVQDELILELKSVEKLMPVHDAQILTYLKLSGKKLGLLMNFNELVLKDGINRFVM